MSRSTSTCARSSGQACSRPQPTGREAFSRPCRSHRGSAARSAPAATSSPAPLELAGSITVPFLGDDLFAPQAVDEADTGNNAAPVIGDTCVTTGGFTDISEGTAVTIGGPDGKTIAVVPLEAGQVTGQAGSPANCTFDFAANVPPGLSEYSVTISHRGTQVFSPAQVLAGDVQLTLDTAG